MTEAKFIIVSGDKGGVGKSVMSTITTDYLLSQGIPAVLIEGDPQINDVAIRFHSQIESGQLSAIQVDLSGGAEGAKKAQALAENLEEIMEEADGDLTVVLNAPASLSSTIDESAGDFAEICHMLNMEMIAVWMIGKDFSSVATAQESKLIKAAHRRLAVVNYDDPDATEWRASGMSKRWQAGVGQEVEMPQMSGLLPLRIKDFRTSSYAAIAEGAGNDHDGKPLKLAYRIPLKRWVRETYDAVCKPLIG